MSKLENFLFCEAKRVKPVTPKQMEDAIDNAEEAFWATISDFIPQAKTDTIDPIVSKSLRKVMEKAVKVWVETNVPKE